MCQWFPNKQKQTTAYNPLQPALKHYIKHLISIINPHSCALPNDELKDGFRLYKQDTNSVAAENPEDDCCEGPSKISKNAIIRVTVYGLEGWHWNYENP